MITFRGPVLGTAHGVDFQKEGVGVRGQQTRHFGGKMEPWRLRVQFALKTCRQPPGLFFFSFPISNRCCPTYPKVRNINNEKEDPGIDTTMLSKTLAKP